MGLFWDAQTDTLKFIIHQNESSGNDAISKRKILADIASIFDILGLIGPVVRAKIILPLLWREKIDWDDPIPLKVQVVEI